MAKKQVFDNQLVEQLTLQFKENNDFNVYQKICTLSLDLMDSIIRSNNFYKQSPFHEIRNYLFTQFPNWLNGWKQDKGKLYSYLSGCIFNGCISYVGKDASHHKRHTYTDVQLDTIGHEDDVSYSHHHMSDEDMEVLKESVNDIVCRWNEPIIRECLRYAITAAMQNRAGRRQEIIKSIVWGYGIHSDTAKFLLDWSLGAVRAALLSHYDSPLGEVDIIRISDKYSFLPDIMNVIGVENTKKLMTIFAGMTIRFPTTVQMRRGMAVKSLINSGDCTPDGVEHVAKTFKFPTSKIQEGFEEFGGNIMSGLLEDYPLFDDGGSDDED